MRKILIGLLVCSTFITTIVSAEEIKEAPKPDPLKQCQVEKQTLESVLVDLARQINREMEIAGMRLRGAKQEVK